MKNTSVSLSFFHLLNPFRQPSAEQVMSNLLEDHERELIIAESAAAYSRKMAEFYKESIARLRVQQLLAH